MNVMLSFLLAFAVVYDLRERRIPNALVVSGAIFALGVSTYHEGWSGFGSSLAAMLLGLLAFIPFFALRFIGAGDVKLFGMVGGFIGINALLPVWLYTIIAGGILGIVSVLLSRTLPQFLRNMKLLLISMIYKVPGSEISFAGIASQTSARIPYAVAIATGTIIWMVLQS